jgi:hypothetical protein
MTRTRDEWHENETNDEWRMMRRRRRQQPNDAERTKTTGWHGNEIEIERKFVLNHLTNALLTPG